MNYFDMLQDVCDDQTQDSSFLDAFSFDEFFDMMDEVDPFGK